MFRANHPYFSWFWGPNICFLDPSCKMCGIGWMWTNNSGIFFRFPTCCKEELMEIYRNPLFKHVMILVFTVAGSGPDPRYWLWNVFVALRQNKAGTAKEQAPGDCMKEEFPFWDDHHGQKNLIYEYDIWYVDICWTLTFGFLITPILVFFLKFLWNKDHVVHCTGKERHPRSHVDQVYWGLLSFVLVASCSAAFFVQPCSGDCNPKLKYQPGVPS